MIRNKWIYFIGLIVSVILIGVYFIDTNNPWCILASSVGASGTGAVFLGFFVDLSNEKHSNKIKEEIRLNKLKGITFRVNHSLTRIAYWYFRISFEVFDENGKEENHLITYEELWKELEKQSEVWQEIFLDDNCVLNCLKGKKISNYYSHIQAELDYVKEILTIDLPEIQMFEVNGYFSNAEINDLKAAQSMLSNNLTCDGYTLETSSVRSAYELMTNIKELSILKESQILYKNGNMAIKYKKFFYSMPGISKNDFLNAIDTTRRAFKYEIAKK